MTLSTLLDAARSGDAAALNELITHIRPVVYRICCRLLRNDADAEDATQVVTWQIAQRITGMPPGSDLERFWRHVRHHAYHRAIDHHRTRRRERGRRRNTPDIAEKLADPADGPERRMERVEDQTFIRDLLRKVTPLERSAIEAYHFQGLTMDQIAQQASVPGGTARRRLHDARKRLKGLVLATAGC